jgi:glycosyltransferase involved in cell wall biosynthesis
MTTHYSFPASWKTLKVVLCHDWLTGMRGGERVLELLCEAFPEAPIFTLLHNPKAVSETINKHPIHASWLHSIPGIERHYRNFLPFFPGAIERFRVPREADVIISTSHCVAKGLKPLPGMPHLCYCFTPMRYAWLFHDEYLGGNPLKKALARPLLAWLRRWDKNASPRVSRFVGISRHIQDRITRFYGREADVVYPPVDLARWTPDFAPSGDFDLIASALVPYKKIDLAVAAYSRSGRRLKIVGTGTEYAALKAAAGANIEFLGWQSDEALLDLYRRCRLLVFPGEEDFGIVPLEAQACGRPVVAYGRGGALETVKSGVSGIFFEQQTPESLQAAVVECAARTWDSIAIRTHAEAFSIQAFINGLATSLDKTLAARCGGQPS